VDIIKSEGLKEQGQSAAKGHYFCIQKTAALRSAAYPGDKLLSLAWLVFDPVDDRSVDFFLHVHVEEGVGDELVNL
jgi:hypothetical protein